jgi:hypothetical protein
LEITNRSLKNISRSQYLDMMQNDPSMRYDPSPKKKAKKDVPTKALAKNSSLPDLGFKNS